MGTGYTRKTNHAIRELDSRPCYTSPTSMVGKGSNRYHGESELNHMISGSLNHTFIINIQFKKLWTLKLRGSSWLAKPLDYYHTSMLGE